MNCWKSVHLEKEFGLSYLRGMSLLISLVAFIFIYLPLSVFHGSHHVEETGIVIFLFAIILLPFLHVLMHVLPLILLKKDVKVAFYKGNALFPICTYYTRRYLTKKVSIIISIAPTLIITVPGVIASFYFVDYYIYLLLLISFHIGISFTDFITIQQIAKAPKNALIENSLGGFDVLLDRAK